MRFFYIVLFVLATAFNTNAQSSQTPHTRKVKGNGRVMEKKRKLPEFEKIEISGNIDVILLNNDFKNEIYSNGDLNLQVFIKTKVENGILFITYDNNVQIISQTQPLKVTVPSKKINEIILKNGAKLSNLGSIEILKLKISASENSKADLKIKTDEVIIHTEGEAELKLSGNSNIVNISHNGTKDLDAKDLSTFYSEIELNSSGSLYSNTVSGIDGNINSTGNLYYKATKTVNVKENDLGRATKY